MYELKYLLAIHRIRTEMTKFKFLRLSIDETFSPLFFNLIVESIPFSFRTHSSELSLAMGSLTESGISLFIVVLC